LRTDAARGIDILRAPITVAEPPALMKSLWYRLPLALKFALPTALLCLLSTLAVIGTTQWAQRQLLHTRLDGLGSALTNRLAASAARPLVDNDPVRLQAVVAEFANEPVVQRAAVFDLQQKLLGSAGAEKPEGEKSESQEYSATVHWQDSAVGRVTLNLKGDGSSEATSLSDLRLRDLLTLAGVLAVAAGGLAFWLGTHFDALLILLTRKLSGETFAVDYPDTDTLGHLLHHPVPPLLAAEPTPPARNGATLLQVYCPSEITVDCERALKQLQAVSKLYRGEITLTRVAGMTVRFAADEDDEMEGPFRALCCAQLLRRLSAPHALRLALAPLAANDDGDGWREQQIIRQLNQACVDVAEDNEIALDTQLQRHPAISERCELEAREEFWIVKALRSPYDTLLERQFTTLKSQFDILTPAAEAVDAMTP
jgi:hypothetical protein